MRGFQNPKKNVSQSFQLDEDSLFMQRDHHISTPKQHTFQVRNLKNQLSFMVSENDTLRQEVKSLNRSLSTFNDGSTHKSSIGSEVKELRHELQRCIEQRDTALQEVLILKQVSTYYKNKDDQEAQEIQNQIFSLQQLIQKKDNIIHRQQITIDEITQAIKKHSPGKIIIDRYILEPTEQSMRIQKALGGKDQTIASLRSQMHSVMKSIEEYKLAALKNSIEAQSLKDINLLLQDQLKSKSLQVESSQKVISQLQQQMLDYQRSLQLLNKNAKLPPPPQNPVSHPSLKQNINYEKQMEERILKIMKNAEAQRKIEEEKARKVIKEMQIQMQEKERQALNVVEEQKPKKAGPVIKIEEERKTPPAQKQKQIEIGAIGMDAALSSIENELSEGRIQDKKVAEADSLPQTNLISTQQFKNMEEYSQQLNTDSILSLNFEQNESLYEASKNHFKHKDLIPMLDLSILQAPPEIINKQAIIANKIPQNPINNAGANNQSQEIKNEYVFGGGGQVPSQAEDKSPFKMMPPKKTEMPLQQTVTSVALVGAFSPPSETEDDSSKISQPQLLPTQIKQPQFNQQASSSQISQIQEIAETSQQQNMMESEQPKTITVNGRKLVVIGSSSSDDEFDRKPGSQSSLKRDIWNNTTQNKEQNLPQLIKKQPSEQLAEEYAIEEDAEEEKESPREIEIMSQPAPLIIQPVVNKPSTQIILQPLVHFDVSPPPKQQQPVLVNNTIPQGTQLLGQTEEIIVEEEIEEEMIEEEEEEEKNNFSHSKPSQQQQQPLPQPRMAFMPQSSGGMIQLQGGPSPMSQTHVRQFSINNSTVPLNESGKVGSGFKPNVTTLVQGIAMDDNQTEIIVEEEEEEETSTYRDQEDFNKGRNLSPPLLVQPQVKQGGWVTSNILQQQQQQETTEEIIEEEEEEEVESIQDQAENSQLMNHPRPIISKTPTNAAPVQFNLSQTGPSVKSNPLLRPPLNQTLVGSITQQKQQQLEEETILEEEEVEEEEETDRGQQKNNNFLLPQGIPRNNTAHSIVLQPKPMISNLTSLQSTAQKPFQIETPSVQSASKQQPLVQMQSSQKVEEQIVIVEEEEAEEEVEIIEESEEEDNNHQI